MDTNDLKKLAETVEAGLRDGRSLESLKNAMNSSGYSEERIKEVISRVERKNTIRRPPRPKNDRRQWIAASVIILILVISISFILLQPEEKTLTIGEQTGITETTTEQGQKICYVVNESIKDTMTAAGIVCDKWILIKEI